MDIATTAQFVDPIFPNLEQYDFRIIKTRKIDENLTIVLVGVMRNSSRIWNLALGTPTCTVEQILSPRNQGTTHDRFLLKPNYYNEAHGSDFHQLLDHVEGVSEKVSQLLYRSGQDVSKWISPIRKSSEGIVEGLYVKVRNCVLGDKIRACIGQGPVRCTIKLSCVYKTKDRQGLSFEIVDIFPQFAQGVAVEPIVT
jgi:hypothetical protein